MAPYHLETSMLFEAAIEPPPQTVAAYLARINTILATQGGRVKGEITSINPSGKAVYFTLKDNDEPALLNCLIWASTYAANSLSLKVGDEIIVTGAPDVYAPFGKFSFKAQTIEYAGEGALKLAYDKLKALLTSEGLLAPERKRPLPAFPQRIGIITSMSGVVIQDFSANLSRRGYKILTVDSRVEGKDAIHDLLAALRTMSKQDIDVLAILRGGGSWESLQAFNTESVVRAIAGFKVPVIAGIGHDADVTLAEMVADIGRSTPTAVAEALNEPWDGLEDALQLLERKTIREFRTQLMVEAAVITDNSQAIFRSYEYRLSGARSDIHMISNQISTIFAGLAARMKKVNNSLLRSTGIMKSHIAADGITVGRLAVRITQQFRAGATTIDGDLQYNFSRCVRREREVIRDTSQTIRMLERAVATNDPRRNMALGYSLSYVGGKLARHISDITVGKTITTQLADGEFTSEVKRVK